MLDSVMYAHRRILMSWQIIALIKCEIDIVQSSRESEPLLIVAYLLTDNLC